MFIKVIKPYTDTMFKATLPVGVILEVEEARADVVIGRGYAEVFKLPAETKVADKPEKAKPIVDKEEAVEIITEDVIKTEEPEPTVVVEKIKAGK